MSKALDDIFERVCDELEDAAKEMAGSGKLSMSDLEKVGELIDIKKNILKIDMLKDGDGYSHAGDWEAHGRFGDQYAHNDNYNDRGNSYRGRRRDSMGRYSGRDGRRGYSRDGGKEDMMEHVEMLMDEAKTPEEREAVKRFKRELEKI